MKKIITVACLLGMTVCSKVMSINIGTRHITNNNTSSYPLSMNGSNGNVRYSGVGLPFGVSVSGSQIIVSNSAMPGNFTFIIKAVDQLGQTAQRTITININLVGNIQVNGGNNGGQTNIGNSITQISNQNMGSSSNQNMGSSSNQNMGSSSNQNIGFSSNQNMGSSSSSNQNIGSSSSSNQNIGFSSNQNMGSSSSSNQNMGSSSNQNMGSSSSSNQNMGSSSSSNQNMGSSSSSNQNMGSSSTTYSGTSTTITTSYNPTINDVNRLNNIISVNTNPNQQISIPVYNSNIYPQLTMPTATTNNFSNSQTQIISNSQTDPSDSNRNTITYDDVKLRAYTQRHTNAIKGITNLLTIIDKARANRDKSQLDIKKYTQQYNTAVTSQRNSQNNIISIQTKSAQINMAMNTLNKTIQQLRNKINSSTSQNSQISFQKQTVITQITTQQSQKANLLQQVKIINQQAGQKAKQLSDKTADCDQKTSNYNNKARQVINAQQQLNSAPSIRPILQNDVNRYTRDVDDLRKRLQQAQKSLADSKIKLSDFDSRRTLLPSIISNLQNQMSDFQSKSKICKSQVQFLQSILDSLKTSDSVKLTNQIATLDKQISTNRQQVSRLDSQIASSTGPSEDLRNKMNNAVSDLNFLSIQKVQVQGILRIAYRDGNDLNNKVAAAKQNLDLIIKRFQDQSKTISQATLNLQRARAQQALARLGLQQLISHYTDALPYQIIGAGNGSSGISNGNNYAGSPLGTLNNSGNGAPGSFVVTDWTNYLSSAYGAGVNPAFPGSVNQLYPVNFLSQVNGNIVINNYGGNSNNCNISNGPQFVKTGTVINIKQTGFDMRGQDGMIYTIMVAPCTSINSNRSNYKIQTGHTVVVKGKKQLNQHNIATAVQLTFLSH